MKTDRGKLRHILQNLISNAIKFTEMGHVTVSARFLKESASVRFQVADTGIGIPKDSLPNIFGMYRQAENSQGLENDGVGLGLYIVKKFTDLLGGKVEVESKVGQGSTFTVTIPSGFSKSSEKTSSRLPAAS
jgi:signal transduction histidine kinase